MLQYHTTFAEIISQGSNNSILSTKMLVYSQLIGLTTILLAGYIQATTIPPPPPIIDHLQTPWRQEITRITVICKIFILLFKSQNSYIVLNSNFDIIIYTVNFKTWLIPIRIIEFLLYCLYILMSIQVISLLHF